MKLISQFDHSGLRRSAPKLASKAQLGDNMGTIAMAEALQPGPKKGHEHILSDRVGKRQAALAALKELKKLREDLPPADAVLIVREGRDSANRNAS